MSILNLSGPMSGGGGVPSGVIVIWSGTAGNIPAGWHLCDGEDGTPDLRDKFVLGAGEVHGVGDEGGEEEVSLERSQIPHHMHYIPVQNTDSGTSSGSRINATVASRYISNNLGVSSSDCGDGSTRYGKPHENMPPYYTLCYIMKL